MPEKETPTPESELALISKVEFKIALADTDTKLEVVLDRFLTALLLKLESPHLVVRNKVLSICHHLTSRVQHIRLPVKALIEQAKKFRSNKVLQHSDLSFIVPGFMHLSADELRDLIPILAKDVHLDMGASTGLASYQLYFILRAICAQEILERGSAEEEEIFAKPEWQIGELDRAWMVKWFTRLMLFLPGDNPQPGIKKSDQEFFMVSPQKKLWNPIIPGGLYVVKCKQKVLWFLSSRVFAENPTRILAYLYAAADGNSALSETAKDLIKREIASADLEDKGLIQAIYNGYLGNSPSYLDAGIFHIPKPAVQIQLLKFLGRSTMSTTFPLMLTAIIENVLFKKPEDSPSEPPSRRIDRGTEANKLRAAIFSYLTFFARNADVEDLEPIATPLIARLRTFVEEYGWPALETAQSGDADTRRTAYEVIGILTKADKKADVGLLQWLFTSLGYDTSGRETTLIIGDALSSLISIFADRSAVQESELIDVLRDENPGFDFDEVTLNDVALDPALRSRIYHARYLGLRFVNQCLPFENVAARLLNLRVLTVTDVEAREVVEEAKRGLDPNWFKIRDLYPVDGQSTRSIIFPPYIDIMSGALPWFKKTNIAGRLGPVVKFAYLMLLQEAFDQHSVGVVVDQSWERRLLTAIENEVDTQDALADYLKTMDEKKMDRLLNLRNACVPYLDPDLFKQFPASKNILLRLVKIGSISETGRSRLALAYQTLPDLKPALFSHDKSLRIFAAEVFGLCDDTGSYNGTTLVGSCMESVRNWNTSASGTGSYNWKVDGSILLLSNHWSRIKYDGANEQRDSFMKFVKEILETSKDTSLLETCFYAVSQISIFHSMEFDKPTIFPLVLETAKKGNERAITTLGHIAMHFRTEAADDFKMALDAFRDLHEVRQTETQFAVGEAISCFAGGWASKVMVNLREHSLKLSLDEVDDPQAVPTIMESVLKDCRNAKPALRKAAAIWLLCLVQYCGHLKEMKKYLTQCQTAFLHCLSDRDEMVQEAASRGLGTVYEMGDRDLKDDLVRNLVNAFSESKSQLSGNVTEDTELFDEGMLRNRDGSIKTYGDILNLAQEAGDSTLVYKYMAIASNNAMWSSRAAFGKFGLSSVLSSSSVDGYLAENPKLYPKLYRYRFDPVENVRRAMNDIWTALVPDTSATLDKYFDPIMEDLLRHILSGKEWRVRQACCAAIADLVQSKPFEMYYKYLGEIWASCFKVLDDIKESVRAAAAGLARTLTGIVTRSLESGSGSKMSRSKSHAMLTDVVPFLLSPAGLESSAKEVQVFSITALLDIVKKASAEALRPFIPELVERIIGLLTSLEPQEINYIHLNADKYDLTEEKIDAMRLNSIRASPLMDAIERCLDLVDDETMDRLVPCLEIAMRTAVGLPSKIGAGRVLVSLATRHHQVFKQAKANSFLVLLQKYVLDRNETVSTSYAVAAGYLARIASDAQIFRLFEFCRNLYLTADDDRKRTVSGDIVYAVAKHASDRLKAVAADILPFVFFAKHDSVASVKDEYQKAWDDTVGGSRSVLLYLNEIIDISKLHLDSPKWVLKHTAARTVADVINSIIQASSTINKDQADVVYPALKKALAGKTWDGKEGVLTAFVSFVEKTEHLWREDEMSTKDIVGIAAREAGRQNSKYRPTALMAIGKIAGLQDDDGLSRTAFEKAHEVVKTLLVNEDDMDVDGDDSTVKGSLRDETLIAAIQAMGNAFNDAVFQSNDSATLITQYLQTIHVATASASNPIHTTIASSLDAFLTKFPDHPEPTLGAAEDRVLEHLRTVLFDTEPPHEALRARRARQIKVLAGKRWEKANEVIWARVGEMVEGEISPGVRETLEEALKVVEEREG
ncbi:ARM repeat-containing protein [Eremomyces bilateralis CBS 781.70]|uniref:ARM repeat-containing protein n=1 Tax=Eremomyces bilateralis CBS 781.70 TaxID=1392243 RepID=A0A6G1GBU8_9PEZI|nr:ARM repeat-containing protein [Eremomyces bilateralis CBS 781.70]KAF1815565.1 ARM repeat-containing protein [Eremomyces bilateralis CBS 781.70]